MSSNMQFYNKIRTSTSYDFSNEFWALKIKRSHSPFQHTSYSPSSQITYNSFIFDNGHKKQRFRLRNLRNVDLSFYHSKEQPSTHALNQHKNSPQPLQPLISSKVKEIKRVFHENKSPKLRLKKCFRPKKKLNEIGGANINILGNQYVMTPPTVDMRVEETVKESEMREKREAERRREERKRKQSYRDDQPITGWI